MEHNELLRAWKADTTGSGARLHIPSLTGKGFIIRTPDETGQLVSWGKCFQSMGEAERCMNRFWGLLHHGGVRPLFSSMAIEYVDFSEGVPLRRFPEKKDCDRTNFAENLTRGAESWTQCRRCGGKTHWIVRPEDNNANGVEQRPDPQFDLTPAQKARRESVHTFMGLHKPSFTGPGYIILSPYSDYFTVSWELCFQTFEEALARVKLYIAEDPKITYCDIMIKEVDFSENVFVNNQISHDTCRNFNTRKNAGNNRRFRECNDCWSVDRVQHWYIPANENFAETNTVREGCRGPWAPPYHSNEGHYGVEFKTDEMPKPISIGYLYKTEEEARNAWEQFKLHSGATSVAEAWMNIIYA
jgi:hypothetical protein